MRSLRLAFRTLLRSPLITGVAILSLALGIGANAAVYSLFDQILLRPLPVQQPDRLVALSAPGPKQGMQSCNQAGDCEYVFSYPMYRDLEAAELPLRLAAHRLVSVNLAYRGQTLNGEGMLVSGSYFPVLGVNPAVGRLLGPADDETIGAHPVAVLGHDFWNARLGADPDVVGSTIIVNGHALTVVGVAPAGFEGTTLGARPLVYAPITMRGELLPFFPAGFDNRRSYWAYVFGRLSPGVTMDQAASAINAVYGPIVQDVEAPLQTGLSDGTMAQFRSKQVMLEDGRRGQSSVHGQARMPLLLLFATAGIVLLIACANIANLLLARGAGRGMEMAVRLSLGASRRRVLGQLLTESVVLAVMGGIASLVVARWTLAGMNAILPPEALTTLKFEVRGSMVVFAAALSVATGLLFGMFPALHSTRPDLVSTIRNNAGSVTATRGAARFRTSLVTAQIALSMALLISAGLFIRSLTNISRVDLGVNIDNVVTFAISPLLNGYEAERSRLLFERLEEELAAVPGVTGVTTSLVPLLAGSNWGNNVRVEGFEIGPDTDANARFNEVGAGYFETLGVPLVAGREFTTADAAGAARVAIVNERFAEKFNLGRDAVGKLMAIGGGDQLDMQIVGLVRDAKYSEVKDDVPPLYFTPWRQDEQLGAITFYVRAAVPSAEILRAIPAVVARLDPNLPVENLKTMPQQVRENVFLDRMIGTMSAAFATLATLLAAVGLYGVLAYSVARRTREIGVRMALGADSRGVLRMVLRQVAVMLLVGGLIGVAAAFALGRVAASLLYGVEGRDPIVILSAVAVLGLFALAAGYIPALRASRIDPLKALRYE
jgi:predicted permease